MTGAAGQLGAVLVPALRKKWGSGQVVASDIRPIQEPTGPTAILDVLDAEALRRLLRDEGITQIYHLAAILSAKGELNPLATWKVNMDGLLNVLEAARELPLDKVFHPSSIAVFGSTTPKVGTPQQTIIMPETVYGISKAAGEDWCQYYHQKYAVDVRSLRYPGLIGYESLPGGGTTDYAVEIFHAALQEGHYSSFLKADTRLPMMYMPDAIEATLRLMEAPKNRLQGGSSYNIQGMSFTPSEIAASIQRHIPHFRMDCQPDFREAIARSWVEDLDDSAARRDWDWMPQYDLDGMVDDMLLHLRGSIS